MTLTKAAQLCICLLIFSSCVSVSEHQQNVARDINIKEIKSPALAATLSILPGVGNLYLADVKNNPSKQRQHSLGLTAVGNWLTWPVSILWAVPQSYVDAQRINVIESVYLHENPQGKTSIAYTEL